MRGVQVVGSRQAFQPAAFHEIFAPSSGLATLSEKSPTSPRSPGEEAQVIVVAHEVAVGVRRAHLLENPVLARFEDARRGDADRARGVTPSRIIAEPAHGFAVAFGVLEIAVDRGDPGGKRRVELRQIADEDDEFRVRVRRNWRDRRSRRNWRSRRCQMGVSRAIPSAAGGARSVSNCATASRRRRLSSLTGRITSPSRPLTSVPNRNGVPPSRPSCAARLSWVSGLLFGDGQRQGGIELHDVAAPVAHDQRQRRARVAVDLEIHRPLEPRRVARERLAQAAVQLRVARFPEPVAGAHPREVDAAVGPRPKVSARPPSAAVRLDRVDPAAFLGLVGLPGVEDHAVARLERRLRRVDEHPFAAHPPHACPETRRASCRSARARAAGCRCRAASRCAARAKNSSPVRNGQRRRWRRGGLRRVARAAGRARRGKPA